MYGKLQIIILACRRLRNLTDFLFVMSSSFVTLSFVDQKCLVFAAQSVCLLQSCGMEYLLCMFNLIYSTSCSRACWDIGVGDFSSFSAHTSNTLLPVLPPTSKAKKTKRYYFRRKPKSPNQVCTHDTVAHSGVNCSEMSKVIER